MPIRFFSFSPTARGWFAALTILGLVGLPSAASAHADDPHPGVTHAPNDKSTTEPTPSTISPLLGSTDCRELTDSILRLYRGYHDRSPTSKEFTDAADAFRSGTANLPALSANLASSVEFATKNGKLSAGEFIEFAFSQTVGRSPSDIELRHWSAALTAGTERASMMLSLTESQEFVKATQTSPPLAGYDRWYPKGTHWYCGKGSDKFPIQPLTGKRISSDFIFVNTGTETTLTELWVVEPNLQRNVQMTSGAVPPKFSDYNWDGAFSGDGNYGDSLDVQASDATRWVIVFYPTSIGENRPGWELIPEAETGYSSGFDASSSPVERNSAPLANDE